MSRWLRPQMELKGDGRACPGVWLSGRVRLAGFLAQSHTGGDIVSTDRLHPLAQQFDAAAQAYARGRPDYGPAVAGAIASELRLTAGGKVLDLAAGTGRLTRGLIEIGLDVVAIEPLPALREILAQSVGEARVADGVAEAIPLADGSVAAVTVAEAFHWFDLPPALAEIRRVLAPGGGLAGLSSFPDWGGASWAHEVGTIIAEARPEHPQFDRPAWHTGLSSRQRVDGAAGNQPDRPPSGDPRAHQRSGKLDQLDRCPPRRPARGDPLKDRADCRRR